MITRPSHSPLRAPKGGQFWTRKGGQVCKRFDKRGKPTLSTPAARRHREASHMGGYQRVWFDDDPWPHAGTERVLVCRLGPGCHRSRCRAFTVAAAWHRHRPGGDLGAPTEALDTGILQRQRARGGIAHDYVAAFARSGLWGKKSHKRVVEGREISRFMVVLRLDCW